MIRESVPKTVAGPIVQAVKRHIPFDHFRVFCFGSRARGTATSRSDYDVGVEASEKIPLDVLVRIEDDLEEIPILQKIELVDFSCVSPAFASHAKRDS